MKQSTKDIRKEIKKLDEDHEIWLSTRGWKTNKKPKNKKEK